MKIKVDGIYTAIDEPHASVSLKLTPREREALGTEVCNQLVASAIGQEVFMALRGYKAAKERLDVAQQEIEVNILD